MSEMNKRYLAFCKPFIDALKEVYSTMVGCEIKYGAPQFKDVGGSYSDYSALMGINGVYEAEGVKLNFKGSLVISWPMSAYLKTASTMLGEEYTELNDEIEDVGMEICNITMGSAKKVLNPMGYCIQMSSPNLVTGENHKVRSEEGVSTVIIPFESKIGTFFIELSYKDVANP